jgi:signal peptidase I
MFKRMFLIVTVVITMFCCLGAQIIEKEYPELKQVLSYGPRNMRQTNDNGFAFVGYSAGNNVYMVKLNAEYEIEWHKEVYARPGQTATSNIAQDNEGYFYIGGDCYSDDTDLDIWYLVKLDSLGNMVKGKIWRPENSQISSMTNFVLVEDGLMVLSVVLIENDCFAYTTFLDKELNIISEKQRKDLGSNVSFRIICSDETGFLLIGRSTQGLWLEKIENDNVIWEKLIDQTAQDSALYRFSPLNGQAVSNGYLIGGDTRNYKPGLVLIDKSGDLIWVKEFQYGPGVPYFGGAVMNCWESKYNDGYIVVLNDDQRLVLANTIILKVDYNGEIQWQQEAAGSSNDAVYLENGNIVCVGRNQQSITCLKVFSHNVKIKSEPVILKSIQLFQNYPNPFNSSTCLSYQIPQDCWVKLSVFNLLGQEVDVLVNEFQRANEYVIKWQPKNLCSGIYIYQLSIESEDFKRALKKKLVIME